MRFRRLHSIIIRSHAIARTPPGKNSILPAFRALPILFLILSLSAPAQQKSYGIRYTVSIPFASGDTIRLPHRFILPGERSFLVDSTIALRDSADYTIEKGKGLLLLTSAGIAKLDTTRRAHLLTGSYRALPFTFPEVWSRRELVVRKDTARGDSIRVAVPSAPITVENIFGPNLQKSGYIGRGITVGTNRDLAINSGFRLQFSGKLASDLDVVAALTDENIPIQPEGNTQTLQEFDKTFIQLNSTHFQATFGDFVMTHASGEFGNFSRKLKGFRGGARSDEGEAEVSYAKLKGSFQTNQFNGLDGVQGPYRLTGRNGEQHILVIAGTERVYVDGAQMTRGETNDYVIEYANGEITFKPRRLITAYSRITVDFEYAAQNYERTFIAAQGTAKLFSDRIRLSTAYLQESDDQSSPIDIALADSDKVILAAAGNDPARASRSGITWAGYDTTARRGAGQYVAATDTAAGNFTYYVYAPGADSALYSIYFSWVGSGAGDYTRKALGYFEYAGRGRGDYLPIRLLPLAQKKEMATVRLETNPFSFLTADGEFALSNFNQNRFSEIGKEHDIGSAYKFGLRIAPEKISLAGADLGKLSLGVSFREEGADFSTIDRANTIEFNRRWNLGALGTATEVIREISAEYRPIAPLAVGSSFGSISRGLFGSDRIDGRFELQGDSLPRVRYTIESIASDDRSASLTGRWVRQQGEAEYTLPFAVPRIRLEAERKRSEAGDSLTADSFSFLDFSAGVATKEWNFMSLSADYGVRTEESWMSGAVEPESRALLQTYAWRLREWKSLSSTVSLTLRDKRFTDRFRLAGRSDFQNILTRTQLRYSSLNRGVEAELYYEVATERTAKLEAVYLPRPVGQGDRKYMGDRNHNGILDDSDFDPALYGDGDWVRILVPGDQLYPVLDLKTNSRIRVAPARFLPAARGWAGDALAALSSETSYRIEEKNSDPNTSDIYLLRLSHFLDDSTTLNGLQNFLQDFFLFESDPALSLRFRFDQRKGFGQFALLNERSYRREQSIRIRTRLVEEIGLEGNYAHVDDRVTSSQPSARARSIVSDQSSLDFSYRPSREVEAGFVVSVKSAVDSHPALPVDASITTLTFRCNYSFLGQGRARFELERNDIALKNVGDTFPFELTDGKVQGKSWVARINVDYRITSFLQATLSYLGRIENNLPAIHTGRAEVRTFF